MTPAICDCSLSSARLSSLHRTDAALPQTSVWGGVGGEGSEGAEDTALNRASENIFLLYLKVQRVIIIGLEKKFKN